ncbi:MAG TPA: winged helix DNA-binding domain-containing protein [Methanocella sp.]|nr:winged helix DNA-binding domain-containing protein [Methanocella sp.]
MNVYSPATVNSHILKGQWLGQAKARSPEEAVKSLLTIDSGSLPNTCFSLSLRVKDFNAGAFQQSLRAGKLARMKGLKGTVQVMPVDLMPAIRTASAPFRESRAKALLEGWGIQEDESRRVGGAIIEALDNKEKTLPQIKNSIRQGVSRDLVRSRGRNKERSTNIAVVAAAMWERWELMRGGTGRLPCEDPGRYSLFSGRFRLDREMSRWEAIKDLAGRYVASYGPVCAEDLAWWLGSTEREVASVLDDGTFEQIKIEGLTGKFFVLQGETLKHDEPPAKITMLPADDPCVKAYARRDRFVPNRYLDRMITRFGESISTVLIGTTVAGTWHIDREIQGDLVDIEMFGPEAATRDGDIEKEAEATGRFFTGEHLPVSISVYRK